MLLLGRLHMCYQRHTVRAVMRKQERRADAIHCFVRHAGSNFTPAAGGVIIAND